MKKLEQRVPNLRFKGFTDDWEQRKLGDLFVYNRPDKYMVQDTNYIDSGTPVLTANKSFVLGYTNENHTYNKLPAIIFDDFTLENKFVKFPFMVKSSAIKILNSRNDQPMMFMYQLLQHSRFVHEGHSRHYISIVQRKDVMVPDNVEEQKKIATLFSRIQNIITLQQRKLELLKEIKKGLLQKMFADKDSKQPILRFKGFHDDWEQRKLGETVFVNSGKDYKGLQKGNIPVYGTGGYMLSVNKYLSNKDAIGIGRKGTINNPYILKAPFWTVDTLFYAIPQNQSDIEFMNAIFQNVNWHKYDESTGVPSLSKSTINQVKVYTTSLREQAAIGSLLHKIEKTISLQHQKLAKYQSIKKSLLQQMFI